MAITGDFRDAQSRNELTETRIQQDIKLLLCQVKINVCQGTNKLTKETRNCLYAVVLKFFILQKAVKLLLMRKEVQSIPT